MRPTLAIALVFTACTTTRGEFATLRGVRPHAAPFVAAAPLALVGDWAVEGEAWRYRFDSGGRLFIVESLPYTLEGNTLTRGPEKYTRLAGTTGLFGVWRTSFPEGEWLERTLGPGGFSEYAWNDGLRGPGFALVEGERLTFVEHRADFVCDGETIHFRPVSGDPYTTTWSVSGEVLTLGDRTLRRVSEPLPAPACASGERSAAGRVRGRTYSD